jgi:hypothetical protein
MGMMLGQLLAEGRTAEVYTLGEDRVIKLFYGWCPSHRRNGCRFCCCGGGKAVRLDAVLGELRLKIPGTK